jgi:hypothetical protein
MTPAPIQPDTPTTDLEPGWGTGRLGAGILFGVLFALYAVTAAPQVTFHDGGELITAAVHLGLAHPPSSPTWCLPAHAFTYLPFGSPAYRVHLFSGFCAALAAAFTYLLVLRLTRRAQASRPIAHASGVAAALWLAQCPSFWEKAVQAEIYTLNALFLVSVLLLLERWLTARAGTPGPNPADRLLVTVAFLFGLAIGNYQAFCFNLPAVLILMGFGYPGLWRDLRRLAQLTGAGLAGLAVYLYLPIRSAANPVLDWGNPETLSAFLVSLSRSRWGELTVSPHTGPFIQKWMESLALPDELGYGALALALVGFGWLVRHNRLVALFLLVNLLVGEGWMMLMQVLTPLLNASLYYATYYGLGEFHIPTYLLLTVFAGCGVAALGSGLTRLPGLASWPRPLVRTTGILALCVLLGFDAVPHFNRGNHHAYTQPHLIGRILLDSVDPESWLVAPGDDPHFVLTYLKFVEGHRPDVALIKPTDAFMDALESTAKACGSALVPTDFANTFSNRLDDFLEPQYHQTYPQGPARTRLFFTLVDADRPTLWTNLYPQGLLFTSMPRGEYSVRTQFTFWDQFLRIPELALTDSSKHDFREYLALTLEHHADWHYAHGEHLLARFLYEQALRYTPTPRPGTAACIADLAFAMGQVDDADQFSRDALEEDPGLARAWTTQARVWLARGDVTRSIRCLEQTVALAPQDEGARQNLARVRALQLGKKQPTP